jgi:hypothetical protein
MAKQETIVKQVASTACSFSEMSVDFQRTISAVSEQKELFMTDVVGTSYPIMQLCLMKLNDQQISFSAEKDKYDCFKLQLRNYLGE